VAYTVEPLGIRTIIGGSTATLAVSGEVDLESASQLREAALAALSERPGSLHIDLSGVTFMDSTGLHVLLATRRRAALTGVQVVVTQRSRTVDRLLQVSGLAEVFAPATTDSLQHAAADPLASSM
jgi:anti-sigma B factor antagonist